jgi:hypothetical protein
LAQAPPQPADHIAQEDNLLLRDSDLINDDLFLVNAPGPALPPPLAGGVDRETTELPQQVPVEINDQLRVDGLPLIVCEGHNEPAGAKWHRLILMQAENRTQAKIGASALPLPAVEGWRSSPGKTSRP